jgi:hypothetical protein
MGWELESDFLWKRLSSLSDAGSLTNSKVLRERK